MSPYISALRPRQWTKNLIVFASPLYGFSINWESFLGSLLAFALFCSVSSSFYLTNDIIDAEADRLHPVKCKRPIAAKLISIPVAIAMGIVLLIGALIIGWLSSISLGVTLTAYVLLQICYNLKLKHMLFLDIGVIASGFILRAYAGAAATKVVLSPWFLLCTAMLALFLAVEKRKAELRLLSAHGGKTRTVLKKYSLSLLNRMENVVTTCTVMSYALWSSGPKLGGASTPWMLLSLPFVLYGIFRYQLISELSSNSDSAMNTLRYADSSERPDEVLLKDFPILITVISWAISCFVILLLKNKGVIG
jgi:decaprenyl-phosphate phosphoribosyltransferase